LGSMGEVPLIAPVYERCPYTSLTRVAPRPSSYFVAGADVTSAGELSAK